MLTPSLTRTRALSRALSLPLSLSRTPSPSLTPSLQVCVLDFAQLGGGPAAWDLAFLLTSSCAPEM